MKGSKSFSILVLLGLILLASYDIKSLETHTIEDFESGFFKIISIPSGISSKNNPRCISFGYWFRYCQ